MLKKLLVFILFASVLTSCQFTETMVMDENGTGRMAIAVNLDEMLGMARMGDSSAVKMDTLISMKKLLEAKSDSIAKLPQKDREKLMALQNYSMHMVMDTETGKWNMETYVDFMNIDEANNLMDGLGAASDALPGMKSTISDESDETKDQDAVGVKYSFENGVFKRDAYIKDQAAHKKQMDSLGSAEAFASGIKYKLNYTFPRKIKKSSVTDATYSLDGKTIVVERSFLDYLRDPDVLDLEVELEKAP